MDLLEKYGYMPDEASINATIDAVASNLDALAGKDVLMKCFSMMDLTTLKVNDTVASVTKFVEKVNRLEVEYPEYPHPASICVFPNFTSVVRDVKKSADVHVTTAGSCFPSAQSFLEVKVKECELSVEAGADEIDVIISLSSFLSGDYDQASAELKALKAAIDAKAAQLGKTIVYKVILETGILGTPENIARASFIAMEAGADFIKTSTGKVEVNATPMAATVMCQCIRKYYEATGRMVGFKAAGGISTAKDALCYYAIVSGILGGKWIDRKYFRLGVSRLGNSLMSAIEQKTVAFF